MTVSTSFNILDFENLIENHGYNAYWQQSIICECYKEGQPNVHCTFCNGRGWRYLPRKHIKVISTSFTGKQELTIPGLKEQGTVYITPSSKILMGYHDKLEFYEVTAKHSQILTMGINETSATNRPIKDVLFIVADNYVFEEGMDFKVTNDKHHLEWINEQTKPTKGTCISALYTTSPEYVVIDLLHELRSTRISKGQVSPTTEELPKQYQARRIDFVYGHTINAKREETKIAEKLEGFNYE